MHGVPRLRCVDTMASGYFRYIWKSASVGKSICYASINHGKQLLYLRLYSDFHVFKVGLQDVRSTKLTFVIYVGMYVCVFSCQ